MSRTRMSRGLVAGVGVVIVLGAVAYLHNGSKSKAEADSKSSNPSSGTTTVAPSKQASGGPQTSAQNAQAKPADKPKQTGQISLPGSAKTLVTQTPGGSTPDAKTVTPSTPAPT